MSLQSSPARPSSPLDKLRDISPDLSDAFKALRDAVLSAGPLSRHTLELIVVATLVATRQHQSLRVHVRRLLADGAEPAELRQAVVATLGASSTLNETIEALDIIESIVTETTK